jgi:hypothetical protein
VTAVSWISVGAARVVKSIWSKSLFSMSGMRSGLLGCWLSGCVSGSFAIASDTSSRQVEEASHRPSQDDDCWSSISWSSPFSSQASSVGEGISGTSSAGKDSGILPESEFSEISDSVQVFSTTPYK